MDFFAFQLDFPGGGFGVLLLVVAGALGVYGAHRWARDKPARQRWAQLVDIAIYSTLAGLAYLLLRSWFVGLP